MKKIVFAAALSLALALPINLAAQNGQSAASAIADSRTIVDRRAKAAIKDCVDSMTTRQKIGSLCVMNFRFWTDSAERRPAYNPALSVENPKIFAAQNTINPTIYKTVRDYHIGSVILFGENMTSAAEAKRFIRDLNKAALDGNNLPLLFFADQEGGNVARVYDFATPSAMAIGKSGDAQNAFLCGKANGQLLLDYGINVDLAPVCDVASNPQNPIIGIRSFSSDPQEAAEFSAAFSQGLLSAGVLPCAKHFPGHGDTSEDSHLDLPAIHSTPAKWKRVEALPFKKNIQDDIPLIMTAHIQCPRLDKTRLKSSKSAKSLAAPATLSKKILTKILRGSLGYKGAVISDAMDMAAIYQNWTADQSFVLAVNAGCDLIINPINVYSKQDAEFLEDFFEKVEAALQSGALDSKALDAAVVRVLELKQKAGLIKIASDKEAGARIVPLPQKIIPMDKERKQEAAQTCAQIQTAAARASFVNVTAPVRARGKRVAVFVPFDDKIEVLQKALAARSINDAQFICYEERKSPSAQDKAAAKNAGLILVFTQLTGGAVKDKKLWQAAYPASLAREIKKSGAASRTIGISMNLPYDKKIFQKEDGFGWTALYNYTQAGYARAVQALFD
ncbi:MAG: glycoside hydrolase family 3 protein [Treponema sp.]|nr:glycoside hydrolase family 3 protein [Treponema sp.]